ncbi:DUF3145 domain-containing protein [Mycetocola tolaasinivorans]|uniref:DUF3145 domain-containing protein n=1 Tax=Mycetocola tolaasinivorans TaxID=76635 RepID=A0A3L7AB57_9MICO|nr:DUF3145 domain-containing protein [Mycetocola tolaasinivorans]RLP76901.1 DUF3145 domain-containing protein [Mycetocola tolaasinivorans]
MVFIHSAPRAFRAHIEWAVGGVIGRALGLDWSDQPVQRGALRAEFSWSGAPGTGARLASALHAWDQMRFEVTEDATPSCDGHRWMFTPDQGMYTAQIDAGGNVVVSENRLRLALAEAVDQPHRLHERIEQLLGSSWDRELDVFRDAGEQGRVTWLHRVG